MKGVRQKLAAVVDWWIIAFAPVGVWAFWTTDDLRILRFSAMFWVVTTIIKCVSDRVAALLLKRALKHA